MTQSTNPAITWGGTTYTDAITSGGFLLIDVNYGDPIKLGKEYPAGNSGDMWQIMGGAHPHKPSSTGRVWVQRRSTIGQIPEHMTYFPTVFDMVWVNIEETA